MEHFVIKARVQKIYPVKTYKNSSGSGKLLKIELIDSSRAPIEAVFFNDAIE